METHLISPDEVKKLSRPISIHVNEEDVVRFTDETEQLDIIPAIGTDLYLSLLEAPLDEKYTVLMNGGVYTGSDGKKLIFKGLKVAIAYYVYAKMVKNDGRILSESGLLAHNDEYGTKPDDKQKYVSYNDTLNVAKKYLADVLEYLKLTDKTFDKNAKVKNNGVRIIAIGD